MDKFHEDRPYEIIGASLTAVRALARSSLLVGAVLATGCGSDAPPQPPPPPGTPTEAPKTVPAEDVAPVLPPAPDPVQVALQEGRFEVVCDALVSEGFSESVCAFLMAGARGERARLNSRRLERFLRGQKVRRVHGRIVGVYETGSTSMTYEARIGGHVSLLETTDTTFSRRVDSPCGHSMQTMRR